MEMNGENWIYSCSVFSPIGTKNIILTGEPNLAWFRQDNQVR